MFGKRKEINPNADILKQMEETKEEMNHCRNQLDETLHPILTDYYIYRLKAEEAKHSYFSELLKEKRLKE